MKTAFISKKPLDLGVLCNISNINNYITTVLRLPMLTHEEEMAYARRWRDHQDAEAADQLVISHLRLVASVSRDYWGYNLPQADLIQEGNIGLMKAARGFDPDRGFRFTTYAMQWIKAEINEYVIKNCRLVKFATTKPHRKLFYNLRSGKPDHRAMTNAEIDAMAEKLNLPRRDVVEMEARLHGNEFTFDAPVQTDEGNDFDASDAILATMDTEPTQMLATDAWRDMLTNGIATALNKLNPRERRIVEARWLEDDDVASVTLKDLGVEFGVSHERVRQIEAATFKKLKTLLPDYKELELV